MSQSTGVTRTRTARFWVKSLWEKLFERKQMLKRSDPTDSPEEVSQAVGKGQPPSPPPQAVESWICLKVKGKRNHFWKRPQGGLGRAGWSEPEGRVPGSDHALSCVGGGGVTPRSQWRHCSARGKRGTGPSSGRAGPAGAPLVWSLSHNTSDSGTGRAGRGARHQGAARLAEEEAAPKLRQDRHTSLPRGKPWRRGLLPSGQPACSSRFPQLRARACGGQRVVGDPAG